jgi:hypothetical protein
MRLIGSITVLIALTGAALADPTYTLVEARSMVTAAIIAEDKCPGVRFSASKAKAMITASHLDAAEVMDKDEGQRLALRLLSDADLMATLCVAARDPRVAWASIVDVSP